MSKGISQVIVAVLLVGVSLSVAGIYAKWAPDLAKEFTGDAADQASQNIKCRNAAIYVNQADYDITGNVLNVNVENTGTIALYNDITVVSINKSRITGEKTIEELEVGEEQLVEVDSDLVPESVKAVSKECSNVESSTSSIKVQR